MNQLRHNLHSHRMFSCCVLAFGLSVAGSALAEPVEPSSTALHLSGFGTVGISHTSAPAGWGFQRETSQPPNDGGTRLDTDTRLGLQANYKLDPRFELVGQLLLTRRLADASPGDPVAWAFAAYRPTENLTVRAGRVSVNLYQLSDYRSVGLAYPFVRPPAEFYGLLPSAFDGLDLTQSWRDGADAIWKVTGYYGQTKQGDNRTNTYRKVRPLAGVFLSREEQGLLVKASYSQAQLASSVPELAPLIAGLQSLASPGVPPNVAAEAARLQRQLTYKGQVVDYFGLGLNFDRDDWLLMLEASHANVRGNVNLDAAYALLGRRFDTLTPYIALSAVRTQAKHGSPQWTDTLTQAYTPVYGAQGAALAAQASQGLGEIAYNAATLGPGQRTLSVGTRWDMSPQTALKLQYDRSRIGNSGSLLWSHGTDEAGSAHVLTATVDFVF